MQPHVIYASLDPLESSTKWHRKRFNRFCTAHGEHPYILQWDALSPSELPLPMKRFGPPSNTWFLGPTQMASPSVQRFLQCSLLWQTDLLTEHATQSVAIGRIYIHNTAMQPNNSRGFEVACVFVCSWQRRRQHGEVQSVRRQLPHQQLFQMTILRDSWLSWKLCSCSSRWFAALLLLVSSVLTWKHLLDVI